METKPDVRFAIWVPLGVLAVLLGIVLLFQASAARMAIEVGLLLSAYSVWAMGSGRVLLDTWKLKDANAEFAALRAMFLVLAVSLLLVVLGFLNLLGLLPWT